MKLIKKVLIFTLSLTLLLQSICLVNVLAKQQTVGNIEPDLLISLEVGDEAFYREADATLKRKEAAMLFVKLSKLESSSGTTIKDVSNTDEYAGYIESCVQYGFMSLDNGGRFNPDKDITYAEFLHGIVNVLHEDMLRNLGKTDRQIAAEYEYALSQKTDSDTLSRYDASVIMARALEAPYPKMSGNMNLTFDENRTLLSEVFEAEKIKGVLTDNGISSLYSASEIPDSCVMINDEIYKKGNSKAELFLGYHVVAYVTDTGDAGAEKVLMIYADNNNDVTTIAIKDLENIKRVSGGSITVKYAVGKTVKSKTLEKDTPIIKNGVASALGDTDSILKQNGSITILAKSDGSNILFMDVYTSIVIDRMSVMDYKLTDKITGTSYNFDESTGDKSVKIIKDGSEISFAKLSTGEVMELYIANDGSKERITAIVSNDTFNGTITGLSMTEKTITVENSEFRIENSYVDILAADSTIKPGKYVSVYFDGHGLVAYVKVSKLKGDYAYMIRLFEDDMPETYGAKMMDMDGNIVTHMFTEKVRTNTQRDMASEIFNNKAFYDTDKAYPTVQQLVKYSVNDDGEIYELYYPESGHNPDKFTVDASGIYFKRAGEFIGGLYRIDKSKRLLVPRTDLSADILGDVNNFSVVTGYMEDDESYDLSIYDCGEDYRPPVIAIYTDSFGNNVNIDNNTSPTMVVKSVGELVNDSNEIVPCIIGYVGTSKVKLSVTEADISVDNLDIMSSVNAERKKLTDLKFGDVITYSTNVKGRINGVRVLYTSNDNAWSIFEKMNVTYDDAYSNIGIVTGTVKDVQSDALFYETANNKTRLASISDGTPILAVNLGTNKIEKISAASLEIGENILIRTNYGSRYTRVVIVFR